MLLRQRITILAIRFLGFAPLGLARRIGLLVGTVMFWLKERNTRNTLNNIRACFPQLSRTEQYKLSRESIQQTCALGFECIVIWCRNDQYLKKKLRKIHGEEIIRDSVSEGRGLVLLAPHLGNWEVVGKMLSHYGETTSLYQPPKYPILESFIKTSRESSGASLVPTNTRGVAALLKALKNGGISGILPDQVPDSGSGEFAPFFGLPAYTMKLVHKLHEKTDCRIVVGFAERVAGGFELHFIEPGAEVYSKDLLCSLSAMNQAIEHAVMKAPSQYQWEYKRFKRGPGNAKPPVDYSAKTEFKHYGL